MSKIDPIYVYNAHRSPVSALCFGQLNNETVLITGSNDGELHVCNLINFENLIKIQVHQSKILGIESPFDDQNKMNENFKIYLDDTNETTTNEISNQATDQTTNEIANEITNEITNQIERSKSRIVNENCKLRFVSQEKNGLIKFVCLFRDVNEQIVNFKIYNELTCSDCTFCSFQVFSLRNYLFLVCISTGTSNCVNLVIMNEDKIILNEQIIKIDQNLGIISSMRMKIYDDFVLLIGTETGSCLIYTAHLKDKFIIDESSLSTELSKQTDSQVDYSKNCIKHFFIDEFSLKYSQQCFHDTFISSIELNDVNLTSNKHLQLICGSVEDCLAIIDLIVNLPNKTIVNRSADHLPDQQPSIELKREAISFKNKKDSTARPVKYLRITNKGINSIAKRMDNKLFASCGYDGRIRLFSLKTLNALAVLTFHRQTIEMIKFSTYMPKYNGYLLAAAGQDKLVTIWSIYNS